MKGCSKKCRNKKNKRKTRKHLGGGNLAYPTNNILFQKPPLAYTGGNNLYPSTGPAPRSQSWLNSNMLQGGGGNNGLPYGEGMPEMRGIQYPDGLTGQSWGGNLQWPGTSSSGGNNHYSLNTYAPHDVSRQMLAAGANPPFSGGGSRKQKQKRKPRQRGGGLSNFLFQDLVNLGRSAQFGVGSTYNTLRGYGPPADPLPWKGQLDTRSRI
jgi:hypothetical protein